MSAFNNAKWVGLSQLTKISVQVIALIVFSRLLEPSEYGIMAMATIVSNFALIIRDLGTGAAVIQRSCLGERLLSSLFWMNLFMGIVIMAIIIILSPALASFFHEGKLKNVLIFLSLTFPIASSSIIHQALLERESRFKGVCLIETISSFVSLLTGLVFALKGFGVYSLVALNLMQAGTSTIGLWFLSKWRPSLIFVLKDIKEIFSFSGNLTLFNLVNYFARNSDGVIVGRFFSSAVLGAYSLSYRVMLFPVQSLTSVISRSLYPVISRQQNEKKKIETIYLRTISFLSAITFPLMFGLWGLRYEFVDVVFGSKWMLVPAILFWLAPTGYIQSLISTTGTIFMACGRADQLLKLGVFSALLQISAFIVGARYNVEVLAMLYFYSNLINSFVAIYYTMKMIGSSWISFLIKLLPSFLCTLAMLLSIFTWKMFIGMFFSDGIFLLVSSIVIGICAYAILYLLFFRNIIISDFPDAISRKIFKNRGV